MVSLILKVGNKTFAFLFIFPSPIYKSQFRKHSSKSKSSSSLCRSWYQWCWLTWDQVGTKSLLFQPRSVLLLHPVLVYFGMLPSFHKERQDCLRHSFQMCPTSVRFWDTLFWNNCFLQARKGCGENTEILSFNNFVAANCSEGVWGQSNEFWSSLRQCNCRACSPGYPSNLDLHSLSCSSLHSFPYVSRIQKESRTCALSVSISQWITAALAGGHQGSARDLGALASVVQSKAYSIGSGLELEWKWEWVLCPPFLLEPGVWLCLLWSLFRDVSEVVSLSARYRECLPGAECGILLMLLFLFYWCFCIANQTQASYCSVHVSI